MPGPARCFDDAVTSSKEDSELEEEAELQDCFIEIDEAVTDGAGRPLLTDEELTSQGALAE